ncbi:hypothetical protein KIPB_003718 [Kipferlia bialata]|uniref:Kelch-type beta propeller n=1 Tax=Kipferlia bialata TaxID=797122 RepID=A0A391NT54_9EUKA|nr:hypothetical protein KIPB_003718 [Kipferlia bialata]|eukprot:g3718.t1
MESRMFSLSLLDKTWEEVDTEGDETPDGRIVPSSGYSAVFGLDDTVFVSATSRDPYSVTGTDSYDTSWFRAYNTREHHWSTLSTPPPLCRELLPKVTVVSNGQAHILGAMHSIYSPSDGWSRGTPFPRATTLSMVDSVSSDYSCAVTIGRDVLVLHCPTDEHSEDLMKATATRYYAALGEWDVVDCNPPSGQAFMNIRACSLGGSRFLLHMAAFGNSDGNTLWVCNLEEAE